jgi:formiminotetrahydrofolate cyclodeaminase
LNDKIAGVASVVSSSDSKPTKGSYEALDDLSKKMEQTTTKLKKVIDEDVPAFNKMVLENQIPAINIGKKKEIN